VQDKLKAAKNRKANHGEETTTDGNGDNDDNPNYLIARTVRSLEETLKEWHSRLPDYFILDLANRNANREKCGGQQRKGFAVDPRLILAAILGREDGQRRLFSDRAGSNYNLRPALLCTPAAVDEFPLTALTFFQKRFMNPAREISHG